MVPFVEIKSVDVARVMLRNAIEDDEFAFKLSTDNGDVEAFDQSMTSVEAVASVPSQSPAPPVIDVQKSDHASPATPPNESTFDIRSAEVVALVEMKSVEVARTESRNAIDDDAVVIRPAVFRLIVEVENQFVAGVKGYANVVNPYMLSQFVLPSDIYAADVFSASVHTSKHPSTAPDATIPSGALPAEQLAGSAASAVAVPAFPDHVPDVSSVTTPPDEMVNPVDKSVMKSDPIVICEVEAYAEVSLCSVDDAFAISPPVKRITDDVAPPGSSGVAPDAVSTPAESVRPAPMVVVASLPVPLPVKSVSACMFPHPVPPCCTKKIDAPNVSPSGASSFTV